MRRLALLVTMAAALLAAPVLAQRDCGNGLPCGNIPWSFPRLPVLSSPTPMPTMAITAIAPTEVSGAVPTPAPAPTNPALIDPDVDGITDQVATLNAVIAATPMIVLDDNGTPVDRDASFTELGNNAGQFFGYARSVTTDVSLGQMTPLVVFSVVALLVVMSVKMTTIFIPLFGALFGIVRKVVQVVLDFIPL